MTNYEKSNKALKIKGLCRIKARTRKLYKTLIAKAHVTQKNLQDLSKAICADLAMAYAPVMYDGVQPAKTAYNTRTRRTRQSRKTLGTYSPRSMNIRIYRRTAAKKKEITAKVAVDTLLHELCHHIDYELVDLANSIHSAGFYKRMGLLKGKLAS